MLFAPLLAIAACDQVDAPDVATTQSALTFQNTYQYQLIPAYYDVQSSFDALTASSMPSAGGVRGAAVANFGTPGGPGTQLNGPHQTWIAGLQGNGMPVLGYVDNPNERSIYDMVQEMKNWISWYNVDGIMFDDSQRTHAQATQTDIARTLWLENWVHNHINSPRAPSGYMEAFNWGQTGDLEQYVYCSRLNAPAGSLLFSTFEGDEGTFRGTTFPGWVHGYGADRFFQLVYGAAFSGTTITNLADDMQRMRQANAGWGYVTEVNPHSWHVLAGYQESPPIPAWDAERAITNAGPYNSDYTCCSGGSVYACPTDLGWQPINGFFNADLHGWTATGIQPPTWVIDDVTGSGVAKVGSSTAYSGESTLLQMIPDSNGGSLTFKYRAFCPDTITYDQLTMQILDENGNVLATPLNFCNNTQTWTNVAVDVNPWKGQTIIIKFNVHDDGFAGDPSYMYVDSVFNH